MMAATGWSAEDIYRIAERGHSLHLQGRYLEAAIIFEGLVSADPENRYCREALAAAWLALGEPHKALEQLDMLIREAPGDLAARVRRSEAYLQVGNRGAARSELEFLRRLLPGSETRRLESALETVGVKELLSEDPRRIREEHDA
jgi:tetratricopeptide (TPR) repeat protein